MTSPPACLVFAGMRRPPSSFAAALLAAFAAGSAGCASGDAGAEGPPNLVLVIADDQDYEHLGFAGHPLAHTPTLDRLAEEGTVFPAAHVPVSRCRPSLASLLSGRWPHQHGIYFNWGEGSLDPTGSLPARLGDAGYATYLAGKFWEGDPRAMGFEAASHDSEFAREGQEELFAFLEEHAGRRPLFVWWSPKLPHWPHDPPARYVRDIDPADIALPPGFAGDAAAFRRDERSFLGMVAWFDDCVRELREALGEAGELEDTLFVYLIDNGSANGFVSKGSPFEKGLRTPIVLHWEGKIPAGERIPHLASSVDVYPTLLDYAGVDVPPDAAGHSLRPWIERGQGPEREVLYGASYPRLQEGEPTPAANAYALHARSDDWKYVLYLERIDALKSELYRIKHDHAPPPVRAAGDEDLFDLRNDPYELHDLAGRPEHAQRIADMRAGLLRWWKETGGGALRVP